MTTIGDYFFLLAMVASFIFAIFIISLLFKEAYHRRRDRLEGRESVVSLDPEYYAEKYDVHYEKKNAKPTNEN